MNSNPKIVAREVLKGYVIANFCQCGCPTHDGLKTNEAFLDHIAKALLSERTTAYKAGMERAAEITKLWDRTTPERIVAEEIAQAIRTEANKEIK